MVALLVVATVAACQPAPPAARSLDPNADVVVPYAVAGGGEVRFTVRPRYPVGGPITFELDITAGTRAIRGPLSGRVLASGSAGERVVRMLRAGDLGASASGPAAVAPGQRATVRVVWDGRDDGGAPVRQDTYSLSLDFEVGGAPLRLGSVIEVRG